MMTSRHNISVKMKIVTAALLYASMLSLPVYSAVLEEIVVTAQKREQNLQDVGISVTAFSGNQIRELGYTNTIDIAAQTPRTRYHPVSPDPDHNQYPRHLAKRFCRPPGTAHRDVCG